MSILLVTVTTIAAIGFSGCTRSSSVGNAISQATVATSNSNQSSPKNYSSETKKKENSSKIEEEKKTSSKTESQRENSSKADEQKERSSKIDEQKENYSKVEEQKESSSKIKARREILSDPELQYESIYHDDEYDERQDIPDTTSQVQNNVNEGNEGNEGLENEEENENIILNEEPYIVVSIEEQMLWYYEYNTVVFSSPVVTGMDGGTPIGTFEILNKAKGITLIGDNYQSYVDYWIAFKGSGYGFHDASWRTEFGGDIYKYDGSHGCVNMPHDKVEELYYLVKLGTPVIIE